MKLNYYKSIAFIAILLTVFYSSYSLMPGELQPAKTQNAFQINNALTHLKEISKEPHYVGTTAHTQVRDYLINQLEKLGLTVEVQKQIAINKKWRAACETQNILAKINGTDPNAKAIMLLTHYDSAVHSSPGASDAGSGVVTILEGIRAFLASKQSHKNDIIILFSDAEEVGLLGANAFVNHHPWAKDVGMVLNFEARGSGGPSYMLLETNGGNKKLIQSFNKAEPNFPIANSLMYSIYKKLPNDTDLTVFREDGNINGFNFAFIDDHFDYHTAQDNFERLNRNTLAHQVDYLTTLLPYYANADLSNLNDTADHVYFFFPKMGLLHYPFSWVMPLCIIACLLFIVIIYIARKREKINLKEVFIGFIPFLGTLILGSLITIFGWKLIKIIHPQYHDILHSFTYNGHLYITAFSALTLGLLFCIYSRYFRQYEAVNLVMAPILFWSIINLLIGLQLKGAGFFIFPVFLALITLVISLFLKKNDNVKLLLNAIVAIPTLIVFVPMIKMFPVGLGLGTLVLSALFIMLIFGLLIPVVQSYKNHKKGSYIFLAVSVLLFIFASLKANYTVDRKQPTSLVYTLDADKMEAYFASYEKKVSDYTKPHLTGNPEKGSFEKLTTASKYNTGYNLHKKTEVVGIMPPTVNIALDTIIGNNRKLQLQITPQRNTNRMEILTHDDIGFKEFIVNGEDLRKDNDQTYLFNTGKRRSLLTYYFTHENEALVIEMVIDQHKKVDLTIYDVAYDLFSNEFLDVKPRTDNTTMPTPFVINDATIIKKQISL